MPPEGPNPAVVGAIKERAVLFLEVYRELTERFGDDEAFSVMSSVSRKIGLQVGTGCNQFAPRDFTGFLDAFMKAPDDGATFQPEIRQIDERGLEVKMMRCPLKEAWMDAGCTNTEVCTLLKCASAYDKAVFEAAGFDYELELWEPGKDGCCLTRLREKS